VATRTETTIATASSARENARLCRLSIIVTVSHVALNAPSVGAKSADAAH
jgi:hypothetical protein